MWERCFFLLFIRRNLNLHLGCLLWGIWTDAGSGHARVFSISRCVSCERCASVRETCCWVCSVYSGFRPWPGHVGGGGGGGGAGSVKPYLVLNSWQRITCLTRLNGSVASWDIDIFCTHIIYIVFSLHFTHRRFVKMSVVEKYTDQMSHCYNLDKQGRISTPLSYLSFLMHHVFYETPLCISPGFLNVQPVPFWAPMMLCKLCDRVCNRPATDKQLTSNWPVTDQ